MFKKYRKSDNSVSLRLIEGPRFVSIAVADPDGYVPQGEARYIVGIEKATGKVVRFKDGGADFGIEQNSKEHPRVYRRSKLPDTATA